jgi:hypothetical protein
MEGNRIAWAGTTGTEKPECYARRPFFQFLGMNQAVFRFAIPPQHRAIWEKDYLWVRVDRRWHGSDEVMDKIKEGYRGGIPWFAILDGEGEVLATSDGPDGNIGFPSEPAGIDHFMSMIKSTGQRISDKELGELRAALETR